MTYKDDLNDLVIKAKQKDKNAVYKIIDKFMPYVCKIIKNVYINNMDIDDLKQMGCVSILYALKKFDPKINNNFTSYVTRAIKNNYYNEIRKKYKENNNVSIQTIIADDLTIEDSLNSNFDLEDNFIKVCDIKSLKNVLVYLCDDEKKFLYYIYKFPKKAVKKYANEKNISLSCAYDRRDKLFKKIRNLMEK